VQHWVEVHGLVELKRTCVRQSDDAVGEPP